MGGRFGAGSSSHVDAGRLLSFSDGRDRGGYTVFRQGAEDGAGLRPGDLQLLRSPGAERGGGAAASGGQPARGTSLLSPPFGSGGDGTGRNSVGMAAGAEVCR